jgi:hypothetical protein
MRDKMPKKDEKAGSFTSFLAGLFISLIFTVIIIIPFSLLPNGILLASVLDVVIAIIVGALRRKKRCWYWFGAFFGLVFALVLFFFFFIHLLGMGLGWI